MHTAHILSQQTHTRLQPFFSFASANPWAESWTLAMKRYDVNARTRIIFIHRTTLFIPFTTAAVSSPTIYGPAINCVATPFEWECIRHGMVCLESQLVLGYRWRCARLMFSHLILCCALASLYYGVTVVFYAFCFYFIHFVAVLLCLLVAYRQQIRLDGFFSLFSRILDISMPIFWVFPIDSRSFEYFNKIGNFWNGFQTLKPLKMLKSNHAPSENR